MDKSETLTAWQKYSAKEYALVHWAPWFVMSISFFIGVTIRDWFVKPVEHMALESYRIFSYLTFEGVIGANVHSLNVFRAVAIMATSIGFALLITRSLYLNTRWIRVFKNKRFFNSVETGYGIALMTMSVSCAVYCMFSIRMMLLLNNWSAYWLIPAGLTLLALAGYAIKSVYDFVESKENKQWREWL